MKSLFHCPYFSSLSMENMNKWHDAVPLYVNGNRMHRRLECAAQKAGKHSNSRLIYASPEFGVGHFTDACATAGTLPLQ